MTSGDTGASPYSAWEQHAGWWQTHFTGGADPEYEEQILPVVAERLAHRAAVLDVGTGEGQLARHLLDHAGVARVVGVDPAAAQLGVATARGGGAAYVRSAAHALPFRSASFDAAVACLVFEHILEVDAAIAEVARVIADGGVFLFLLNHPLLQTPDSGWIDDHILEEQYWRIGPYLVEDISEEEVAPGVTLPFVHRPLSRYVNALVRNRLYVEEMLEPAPPPGFIARAPEYAAVVSIPRLLVLRCIKRS